MLIFVVIVFISVVVNDSRNTQNIQNSGSLFVCFYCSVELLTSGMIDTGTIILGKEAHRKIYRMMERHWNVYQLFLKLTVSLQALLMPCEYCCRC